MEVSPSVTSMDMWPSTTEMTTLELEPSCIRNFSLELGDRKCLYPTKRDLRPVDQYVLILYLPVLVTITIIGLIGNTLSYIVLSREMQPTCSSICLKALAIADNLVLVTYCCFFAMPTLWRYCGVAEWITEYYQYLMPYLWAALWFSKALSVYIIVQMTIERFIAICVPLKAPKWCNKTATRYGLLAIVIVDLIYNIPKIFLFKIVYKCDPCTGLMRPKYVTTPLYRDEIFGIVYTKALYITIMFAVPLTILFVLNCLLIRAIRKANRERATMSVSRRQTDNASEKIIGVVIAFLVLETPAVILNIIYILKGQEGFKDKLDWKLISNIMRSLYVISTINSCINFYIYCLVGKQFRRILWRMIWSCGRRGRLESIAMTRTTTGISNGHKLDVNKAGVKRVSASSIFNPSPVSTPPSRRQSYLTNRV